MSPDQVIKRVAELGITISRRTLNNYEKWGLISPVTFRNSRKAIYPEIVVVEVAAAWLFLRRIPRPEIKYVALLRTLFYSPVNDIKDHLQNHPEHKALVLSDYFKFFKPNKKDLAKLASRIISDFTNNPIGFNIEKHLTDFHCKLVKDLDAYAELLDY
ncbi:hypothetical protein BHU72_11875 [Desulfuribacillus stibiiarsenatis]|uniref:Uncharacterized protein n=1 Tax=Desulfuribacillus stibiiarsenatis TaxID=1390249 RepID=A0A1E5L7U0_9FIRM|nr:hypothetical protein [Desulfuribacillus stibiiarsenatis]OEH86227.1 hypothetical protein BHU72_11875 [Desulfuribacillus stibiiarsenatis]